MKKIAVFKIENSVEANNHLSKFPPEQVAIVDGNIVINYDDQSYPDSYKAEEIRALMLSNTKQMMTTNISIKVSLLELRDVELDINKIETELNDIKNTEVNPDKKMDPKTAKELRKDRDEKIKAREFVLNQLTDKKKNIENAINGLRNSVKNYENKNKILAEEISLLSL